MAPGSATSAPEATISLAAHNRLRCLALTTALAAAVTAVSAAGAPGATPATANEGSSAADAPLLVRFRGDADARERRAVRESAGVEHEASLPVAGLQVVQPERGVAADEAIARLEDSAEVLYAEPDALRTSASTPSDSYFGSQWGLHNAGQRVYGRSGAADADIDAPEAWDLTTGSSAVSVGVIDSGVELDHPDLAPNLRRNPGESGSGREGNGIDDDRNGYVDDVNGWDWVDGDNSPADANGHGTHVAGTIGARGNDGAGVTGVSQNAGLVPLRVLGADGRGRVSDVIRAYTYAARSGIRVVNASLSGAGWTKAEQDALAAAPDTLFVVAAGNEGVDNEATPSYPCNYPLANVVCVAATDQSDALASFSNYGAGSVDLAAPGTAVLSTYRDGGWAYLQGTSMATPHVAGAAALVWSLYPSATVRDVRASLLENVDVKPSLSGRVATGGRLNAYRALSRAPDPTPAPSPAPAAVPVAPTPAPPAPRPEPESGAGGPETSRAPLVVHRPRAFHVRKGKVRRGRGARSRLFRDDGRRLELVARRSGRRFVADGFATIRISRARRRALDRLVFAFDGGVSSRRAVVSLRVYDWERRRWRTVRTLRGAGRRDRGTRWSVTSRAGRYVSRGGRIRVAVRGTAAKRFRARTDLIRVSTR